MNRSTSMVIAGFIAIIFAGQLPAAKPITVIPPPQEKWIGSREGFGFANNSDVIYARYALRSEGTSYLALYSSDGKEIASQEFASGRPGSFGDSHAGVILDNAGEWVGRCSGGALKYFSTSVRKAPEPLLLANANRSPTPDFSVSALKNGGFLSARNGNEGFFVSRWSLEAKPSEKILLSRHLKLTDPDERSSASALNGAAECFARATEVTHTAGDTFYLTAWDLKAEKPTKIVLTTESRASCLRIQDDAKRIVAGFDDGTVAWYDIKSWDKGEVARSKSILTGQFTVSCVDVHPTGNCIACVTYDAKNFPNLYVISTETGEILSKVTVDHKAQMAVAFNTTGTKIATFGSDGTIRIFDARLILKLDKQ